MSGNAVEARSQCGMHGKLARKGRTVQFPSGIWFSKKTGKPYCVRNPRAAERAAKRMRREMETPEEKAKRMRREMETPEKKAKRMRREMETPEEKAKRMLRTIGAAEHRERKKMGVPTLRAPPMSDEMKKKKRRLRYYKQKLMAPYLTLSALSRDHPKPQRQSKQPRLRTQFKRQSKQPRLRTQFKRPKGAGVDSMGRGITERRQYYTGLESSP